jgi:cell division protease FtsH
MPPAGPPPDEPESNRAGPIIAIILIVVPVLLVLGLITWSAITPSARHLPYERFMKLAEGGKIKKLTLVGADKFVGEVRAADDEEVKSFKVPSSGKFFVILPPNQDRESEFRKIIDWDQKMHLAEFDKKELEPVSIMREEDQSQWLNQFFYAVVPTLILVAFFVFFVFPKMRDPMGGGMFSNYVRSPAKKYEKPKVRTTFADVAGMDGSKNELQEIVEFLKNPEKFHLLGAEIPRGVLLVGPPGTGKTLLARAVAGEAGVPFYSINGSEFIQMFVGVGASRVRDLFRTARETAPCLIFIDEIDAVGRMRGAGVGGGSDEREQTLNQILSEMDGFTPVESVIVIAATNRPDVLDSALLRPGRFDRHVTVDRPTWQGRIQILKVHTRSKPLAENVDLERIARAMIGMSGAELRNLANEAALLAAREGKTKIEQVDFDRAADRIRMGPRREEILGEDEKKRTAYHETGHALCGYLLPSGDKLERVSVLPRGRAAGVTVHLPEEDRVDITATQLFAKLVMIMGGRAADRLIFNEATTGATQDLKQATKIARMMVTQFGMSEKIGPVSYRVGEDHVFLGKELAESRDFSEGTAEKIDNEIQRLLREADHKAYELLASHRPEIEAVVALLMDQEELTREQFEQVVKSVHQKTE